MATHTNGDGEPYILLSLWCSETTAWRDLPARYAAVGAAESAASARGIYRVVLVCGERRLPMEPFAVVGSHPADEAHSLAERRV
jgi:hypothetical protein